MSGGTIEYGTYLLGCPLSVGEQSTQFYNTLKLELSPVPASMFHDSGEVRYPK